MKVAIMQPYFFPYAGYFSLMVHCDEFVLFDTPQYDRKGWMHRNRILKCPDGWRYIHLGIVKPRYQASINDVMISKGEQWKIDLLEAIRVYTSAPYYVEVNNLIENIISLNHDTLVSFNYHSLSAVRDYLSVDCPIKIYSRLSLGIDGVEHPGQWALKISQALGVDEYINPYGGAGIFEQKEFDDAHVELSFLKHNLPPYLRGGHPYEPGLSIIDLLMFCAREDVVDYLRKYNIYKRNEIH